MVRAEGERGGGVRGGEGAADADMLLDRGYLNKDVDQLLVFRVREDKWYGGG